MATNNCKKNHFKTAQKSLLIFLYLYPCIYDKIHFIQPKTTIMNKLYGNKVEVQNTFETKDETIVTIKNGIVINENPKNSNQKTLKYSLHLDQKHRLDLNSEYPFVFVQPTYKSVQTIFLK